MGNVTQSTMALDSISDGYDIIKEEDNIKILQEKITRKQFALKELYFINKTDYSKYLKQIVQVQKVRNSQHIVELIKYWSQEQKGVCSNIFKIYMIYEYPQIKLKEEIDIRQQNSKFFKEQELITILSICINAFIAEEQFIYISPQLIFITEEGNLKLINPNIMHQHYKTSFHTHYYYSPEKFQHFSHQETNNIDRERIFSLGMTLLHAATLKNPMKCYDLSTKTFNSLTLDEMLGQVSTLYSQFFVNMLENMLKIRPRQRWEIIQLQKCIDDYLNDGQHIINKTFNSESPCNVKYFNSQARKTSKMEHFSNINLAFLQKQDTSPVRLNESQYKPPSGQKIENYDPKMNRCIEIEEQKKISHDLCAQNSKAIFTDPKMMQIIKQGISKIQKSHQQRRELEDITASKNSNNNRMIANHQLKKTPCNSSKDLFSQYQFVTSSLHKEKYISLQYEDGSRYQGGIENNKRNGFGKLLYEDGAYYQGFFRDGVLCGKGSLYFAPNRPAYIGNWENNKFFGNGILFNEYPCIIQQGFDHRDFNRIEDFWIKYQGTFMDDKKEGKGMMLLTNGERIQGSFSSDRLCGQCMFTTAQGNQIRGKWHDNILISPLQ